VPRKKEKVFGLESLKFLKIGEKNIMVELVHVIQYLK